ncbi:MAG: hypothetical protein SPL08_04860 [Pseudomonadota bacterium]|nr:hypothetical protein [Pseudomonadota bacterium]
MRLKQILSMGSIAVASALAPISVQNGDGRSAQAQVTQKCQEIATSQIVNETGDDTYTSMLKDQFQLMAKNTVGANVLRDLPNTIKFIIRETPDYAEAAGLWDGQNCAIYDDTLLSGCSGTASVLIAHEGRHAIQDTLYAKDYTHMPTEQQIIYNKMMEIETRLQDVLMKEDFYQRNFGPARQEEMLTADWMDYRRLKASIQQDNPKLPISKIERMARTQFVIDSWQGNYHRQIYDQSHDNRTFRNWTMVYNEKALQNANKRCLMVRPVPDLTVDEAKVSRHHQIMQDFIGRMGIDVPPDFFDDLSQDKSMRVMRHPEELAVVGKYFEKDLKLVVMPKDDFVRVGGIAIGRDNSTVMFGPEQRRKFEQEIQNSSLKWQARQGER